MSSFVGSLKKHYPHNKIFRAAIRPPISVAPFSQETIHVSNPSVDTQAEIKVVLDKAYHSKKQKIKKQQQQNNDTAPLHPFIESIAPAATNEQSLQLINPKKRKKEKKKPAESSFSSNKRPRKQKGNLKGKKKKNSIFDDYN